MTSRLTDNQFFKFLIAGGIAALANFGSRIIFSNIVSFEIAVVLAFLVGMIVAFVLMKGAVFKSEGGDVYRQIAWFFAVNMFALAQTFGFSLLFAQLILPSIGLAEEAELLGHAIGVAIPVATSYVGHRLFTFN